MNLRFLVLIRGMREEGESEIFLCYPSGSETSHQSFRERGGVFRANISKYLHLIKPMVVGFCWRCNWIVGSSIKVLTDLILFSYQTAIKYRINFDY